MNESVNSVVGGGAVTDGQKHPDSQPPHSKETEVWGMGWGDSSVQGLGEGDSAPFPAKGKVVGPLTKCG